MFVFVVPLKSKARSTNWNVTSELCRRSIHSMIDAPGEAKVILVCHDVPAGLIQSSRLLIKTICDPVPETAHEMMVDKYHKIAVGLKVARKFTPCWLMRADADDLISRRLVSFIESCRPGTAWYAEIGWAHRSGSRWVQKLQQFHLFCGTSCITSVTKADLRQNGAGECYLLTQGHNVVVDYLKSRHVPIHSIPFPSVIYEVESGENCSGPRFLRSRRLLLRQMLNTRPLTRSLRDEFGLTSAGATWGSA